jgi:hypothetical protein
VSEIDTRGLIASAKSPGVPRKAIVAAVAMVFGSGLILYGLASGSPDVPPVNHHAERVAQAQEANAKRQAVAPHKPTQISAQAKGHVVTSANMTDIEAATLGPNESILKYFDKNHDRNVDGLDWALMTPREQHACAIFSIGVVYGFMAGVSGQIPSLKKASVKREIIDQGKRFWLGLDYSYAKDRGASIGTIEAANEWVKVAMKAQGG